MALKFVIKWMVMMVVTMVYIENLKKINEIKK